LFGCSDGQVDKLMDAGVLDFVRIGNRRQPTVASIERQLGKPIEELEASLRSQSNTHPALTAAERAEKTADGPAAGGEATHCIASVVKGA
jgi:hypothetical protein